MNKLLASSVAIAMFLLAGCAATGPKLANNAEDIAGTWQSTIAALEIQFNEDGTGRALFATGQTVDGEFRFEGTKVIWKTLNQGNDCVQIGAETGIYEVELLENGNLKFTVIEDDCATRANYMAGQLVEVEWEPVP